MNRLRWSLVLAVLVSGGVLAACHEPPDISLDEATGAATSESASQPHLGDPPPEVDPSTVPKELVRWTDEALAIPESEGDGAMSDRCRAFVQGALTGKEEAAPAAADLLKQELDSSSERFLPDCVAALHRGLGQLAARASKLSSALGHYSAARYVASRQGDVASWLVTHLDIASLHYRAGRLDESLAMINEGLPWFAALESEEKWHEAAALTIKGRILVEFGWPSEGISELNQALDIRRQLDIDRPPSQASFQIAGLNALGRAYMTTGRLDEALPVLKRVVALTQGWWIRHAHALNELADYHLLRDDPVAAQECLDQVDRLAKDHQIDDLSLRLQTSFLRAREKVALGRKDQGIDTLRTVVAGFEALRGQGEELYAPFLAQRRFYLDVLIRWLGDEGRDSEAFEIAEFVRARGLLDAILWPPSKVQRTAPANQVARMAALRQRLTELVGRGGPSREILAAKDALLALEDEMRRLAGAPIAEPIGLASAASQLQEGDLLLVYWLGDEEASLWLLDGPRGQLRHVGLSLVSDRIEESVKELQHWLAAGRPGSRGAQAELAGLGQALLAPISEELASAQNLVVVTDGALASVPFAALPDPADGEPLIRHRPLASIHSLSVLAAIRQRAHSTSRSPQATIAAFADPIYLEANSGTRPSLPASAEAARQLVRLVDELGAGSARLYLGSDASRQAVLAGAASGSRFVHFGAHVELNSVLPDLSTIHLAEADAEGQSIDGALRLQDLDRLELSAQVVTLAGCSTALGRSLGTEGPMAFPRGFLFAGADSVVASLWRVRDEPTAELMTEFYRGLLVEDLSPAEALRQAQIKLLDGKWPSPEHWAGFVLLGEWAKHAASSKENQPFPGSGVYPR